MRKLLCVIALVFLSIASFATTAVTGVIKDLGTQASWQGTYVRLYLRGCSAFAPYVNGTTIFPKNTGGGIYKDFAPDANGNISGTIYSTRAADGIAGGEVTCNGSTTAVWIGVVIVHNGSNGNEVPVHSKNGVPLDLTNLSPIQPPPPPQDAATGDTRYCQLTGANCGFTGAITLSSINSSALPTSSATYDLGSSTFKWRDLWLSRNLSMNGNLGGATLSGAGAGNTVTLLSFQGILSPLTGNGALQTFYTYTIPANVVAAGKGVRITLLFQHAGVNSVTYSVKLGSCTLDSTSYSDTNVSYIQYSIMNNAGVQNAQNFIRYAFFGSSFGSGGGANTCSENLANAVTFTAQFNVANTDSLGPKGLLVELIQ